MTRLTRAFVALFALLTLTACGSFGHTSYEITHKDGGCDFKANDGKEFSSRNIAFNGTTCQMQVMEGESKAFAGQAIGAKVMTIMPVTGLKELVPAEPVLQVK
jgi:hypothetical protein